MIDFSRVRLGRVPSGPTPNVLELGHLAVLQPLPAPPSEIDWSSGTGGWPMLGNDIWGDCTVAGVLHYRQAAERFRDGVGRAAQLADAEAGYRAIAPGWDGQTEGPGATLADIMTHWRDTGFSVNGEVDPIGGFIRVRSDQLQQGLWMFGPQIVGALLPLAAQTQDDWSDPPDVLGPNAPGSLGGHCMLLTAWRSDGSVDLVTWGGIKRASAGWVRTYIDEAWSVLHPVWNAAGISPSGWHQAALAADLARLA